MRTIMLSLPMSGRTDEEILNTIISSMEKLSKKFLNKEIRVIHNFNCELTDDNLKNENLFYLGEAIKKLAKCDTVYFCKGWQFARGCVIEHSVCEHYGIEIIYEE